MTKYLTRRIQLCLILLTAAITIFVISSCQLSEDTAENASTATVATTITPRPYRTPTPQTTPTVAIEATEEDTKLTLTVWTIESISPDTEGEAGTFISSNLRVSR